MLKFLRIKKVKDKKFRSIIFREKYKYANNAKEKYISKKTSLLIFGLDTSGKTKELNKIYKKRDLIFSDIKKRSALLLHSTDSIAEIIYNNINEKDIENYILSLDELKQIEVEKHINKQFFKIEVLKHKAKGSYLFVDDIDKFSGKKLEVLKTLVKNCKQLYATAKNEKTINKTIFKIIETKGYTFINLKTKNSFDATYYALILLMIPFALSGHYEVVVMLLLANRYLDKGLKD